MKTKALQAVIVTSLLTVAASYQSANAVPFMSQAGSNCAPINQNQAFELAFSERGVINFSTTRSLWITCPVPRVTGTANAPLNLVYSLGNITAVAQDVTCIARRYDQLGNIQESASNVVSVPAAVPPDDVAANGTIATTDTPADFDYYSLTCKLPQGVALGHYISD